MTTPVLVDLVTEVAGRCGLLLAEAGVYLLAPDGSTPCIIQGIRRGMKAVALTLNDPQIPADADVANLSTFAIERVIDEAEWFSLNRALLSWWRVAQKEQEAVSSSVVSSGWRLEQKRAVKDRTADLKALCMNPYREPTDTMVAFDRFGNLSPTTAAGAPPSFVPGYSFSFLYGMSSPFGFGGSWGGATGYGYGGGGGFGYGGGGGYGPWAGWF